jgi:hypothetical protein
MKYLLLLLFFGNSIVSLNAADENIPLSIKHKKYEEAVLEEYASSVSCQWTALSAVGVCARQVAFPMIPATPEIIAGACCLAATGSCLYSHCYSTPKREKLEKDLITEQPIYADATKALMSSCLYGAAFESCAAGLSIGHIVFPTLPYSSCCLATACCAASLVPCALCIKASFDKDKLEENAKRYQNIMRQKRQGENQAQELAARRDRYSQQQRLRGQEELASQGSGSSSSGQQRGRSRKCIIS